MGMYSKSKCPHCGKYCITHWKKMNLMDLRFTHNCKECGGTIKLASWYYPLCIFEILVLFLLKNRFGLNEWNIIVFVLIGILVYFIQMPLIPIKKGSEEH